MQDKPEESRRHSLIPWLILMIAGVAFSVFCFTLARNLVYGRKAKDLYDTMANMYQSVEEPAEPAEEAEDIVPDDIRAIQIDYESLEEQNPDYVAWMIWRDAGVDLPVLFDADSEGFYLHHLFDKTYNYAGCLVLSEACSRDFTSRQSIIFGHNMKNGSMFGYMNDLYWDPDGKISDPHFYINVDGKWKGYAIFAMESIPQTSDLFRISDSDDDYDVYVQEALSGAGLSFLNDETQALLERRCPIVMLSTCDGGEGATNRLVTFGVETKP